LAKKKKSRFKIRYLLILLVLYFLYRILVVSIPVGKASINYLEDVTEKKKSQVGSIVKKAGVDNLKALKDSIESLVWVESVALKRNILGELKIRISSRIPVARIADTEGKVIDRKGFIFDFEKADSLPAVEIRKSVSEKDIAQAVGIFKVLDDFSIKRMRIGSEGVKTECSNIDIEWGNDEFEKKYEILKIILADNINNFKGKLDFRFRNMVVLRR